MSDPLRDTVYYHRNCFDARALFDKHLPVVGRPYDWLKRSMG
ncbi:hypothetical protein PS710_06414 [Pseudomonas fluorescens]|uniref:Uncharacterized protein n=1 Tax=Pseudomonas fluorescens TaxID=294 RepID=A0A5E7FYF8_PSEFL|nr:hypothetical protein PS710_06414 [Pseudomonas fluorescens]